MNAHLLIEGGSSAQGFGDEARRGGYAGRLYNHYFDYGQHIIEGDLTHSYPYVYTHTNGLIGNYSLRLARTLPHSIQRVHEFAQSPQNIAHLVAVIAIGGNLDRRANKVSPDVALEEWRLSLQAIRRTCEEASATTFYLGVPEPDMDSRQQGRPVDMDIHKRQMDITRKILPEYVPYVDVVGEDCIGDTVDRSPLYYGLHPNALGYDKMTSYLMPLVDNAIGIQSSSIYQ